MCAQNEEAEECSVYAAFPFTEGFADVVDGRVSLQYLDRLAYALLPLVDVASEAVSQSGCCVPTVQLLVYCTAALARVRVAQAYAAEVRLVDSYGRDQVLCALEAEWAELVERDQMVFVDYSPTIDAVLGDVVRTLWRSHALEAMLSVRDVMAIYGPAVATLRVAAVGEVFVEEGRGRLLSDLPVCEQHRCVLSAADYRAMVAVIKTAPAGLCEPVDVVRHVQTLSDACLASCRVAVDWLWMLASGASGNAGYCYQLLIAPRARFMACEALGHTPVVSELLWYLGGCNNLWAAITAEVCQAEVLHVSLSGSAPLELLEKCSEKRIGMPAGVDTAEPDYFARALVDDFIRKHRHQTPPEQVFPVDAAFETLTLDTSSSGVARGFVDVARELYSGVGETVSPRAEAAERLTGGVVASDDALSELDSERVRDVHNRLADGAVIEEDYFKHSRSRFRRNRRRPRLVATEGHAYHVFAAFPADGGGGTGPWELDNHWDIPGWQSYIATFDPGTVTLSFVSPGQERDVRMDCTGDGALEFGDCKVATRGTVLWFSNSVKFQLIARSRVALRISVPDAGGAVAIGADMRRYLYIPGFAVAARSYDIVVGNPTFGIPLVRARASLIAGCHFYVGETLVPRGRHRFKLVHLPSVAPVKMVLRAEPVEALAYLSVCGMRLKPQSRHYVSVLFDARNVDLYLTMNDEADIRVSVAQVVRLTEFDLTVASTRVAASLSRD